MEENENIVQEVKNSLEELRKKPMAYVVGKAIRLGAEAYRLKAIGEENSICFKLSRLLSAIKHDRSGTIKQCFIKGWGAQKADMGGFKDDPNYRIDLPKHLLGPAHVKQEAYELLAQR